MNLQELIKTNKNKIDYILVYEIKNNIEEHIYDGLIDEDCFTEKLKSYLNRKVKNYKLENSYLRIVIE